MDIKQTKMLKLLDNCHPPSHKSTECDAHDPPTKKQQPPDNTFETVTADKFSQNNNLSQSSIISVTGTNGKTIVAQMITHILNEVGHTVKTKFENDQINKESAKDLNTVSAGATGNAFSGAPNEIFVLETSRQEILERGLIYEWSDISIITNIQPDVDESSEVESKNEVLQVKSLIAERVRKYGTLVLNADDELLMRLGNESRITQIEKKIVYFSLKPNHILLRRHISAGGTIYTIKNNWLVEVNQTGETRILEISDVPATFNGTAEFNVSNVLAAVAGCRAQNLSAQQIALALQSFQAPVRENNVASFYEVDGAYIFFDYTSNYQAFKAVCQMAANLDDGERRVSAIIGFPGDWSDKMLAQAGYLASRCFDRITLRENHDLRGRVSGETVQILYQAIKGGAPEQDCRIILSEDEALRREITRLRENDILICFYENSELIQQIIKRCEATPTLKLKKEDSRLTFNLRQA